MNKKINNFSTYLLIASLGFASMQATDRKKEPKRTEKNRKNKKIDIIIPYQKIIIGGGVLICLFLFYWISNYLRNSTFKSSENNINSNDLPEVQQDQNLIQQNNNDESAPTPPQKQDQQKGYDIYSLADQS